MDFVRVSVTELKIKSHLLIFYNLILHSLNDIYPPTPHPPIFNNIS